MVRKTKAGYPAIASSRRDVARMNNGVEKMEPAPAEADQDSLPQGWRAGPGIRHGGMLSAARRLFPNAPQPLIDLSTGINPVAYKLGPFAAEAFTRLPDADDENALCRAAAAAYGVAGPAMIVAAPGTQVLISLLPHLLPDAGRKVAILSPTYGEHAASWRQSGRDVVETGDFDALSQADIAVVCNPNNPDGRRIPPSDLLSLAGRLAARGGLLVVDEAFADLEEPGFSLTPHLPVPGVIVLRSFGKPYGLAGLRLGFALAESVLATRLRAALGPWAVSGPALAAGLQALPDATWRAEAIARLDQDVARLDQLLTPRGLTLVGGTRLFRLYEGDTAGAIHQRLGEAGILVRRFLGQPRRLRFGLPESPGHWIRLAQALRD